MTFLFLYTLFVREIQKSRMQSEETRRDYSQVRRGHEEIWQKPLKNKTGRPLPED